MPPAATPSVPLVLVCGDDEFAVKQRARQIFQDWSAEIGGMDHEIIDASVTNSGEALKSLAKLQEALQTLPFFGTGKAVWLQNCNFLGEERAAGAAAVTESLAEFAQALKTFEWKSVRLLISAGKVDKRKVFYKAVDKLGAVESFAGLSADDRDWEDRAELMARQAVRSRHKEISDEAVAELVANVGPNARLLDNEVEKLALFVGDRSEIELADVSTICTRNKSARAFALADALGDRDLPRLLRTLDGELWEMKLDSQKSEIGLLYGIIGKVRAMILVRELAREGWIKPDADYTRFKAQLEKIPISEMPEDKRFNPLGINSYVLFKALPQARRFTPAELVAAMDLLLQCNRRLISSSLDGALILQQTLIQIAGVPGRRAGASAS